MPVSETRETTGLYLKQGLLQACIRNKGDLYRPVS
jgi:hypothetical protein